MLKCWHLLQALAGLECDTLLYTKGLGPCSRHKKTSICPSPRGQHTYEMTVSIPHTFFSQPLTLIKTTNSSYIPPCWRDSCSALSLRCSFRAYVRLGVNCCCIASCVWLNGFNMSPAQLWLLCLCCSRLWGYTAGFCQQWNGRNHMKSSWWGTTVCRGERKLGTGGSIVPSGVSALIWQIEKPLNISFHRNIWAECTSVLKSLAWVHIYLSFQYGEDKSRL